MSKEYSLLFNEITKVSENIEKIMSELTKVSLQLMYAQQQAEEMYIETDEAKAS
jgi:hypothetical protein